MDNSKMEKKKHMKLLKKLKQHFSEDEKELEEEEGKDMAFKKNNPMKKEFRKAYNEDDDDMLHEMKMKYDADEDAKYHNEDMDEMDYNDHEGNNRNFMMEDEDESEEGEDYDERMPKKDRKDLAVMILAKRLGRRKR